VIDNADLRSGELSLQKKYGKRTAVICGDYLLSLSLIKAAAVENKEDYLKLDMPSYVSRVCLGELDQHINNGNYDLSVYRYLKIISGKTAALFEASFYAGAILSETDPGVIKKYIRFGRYIGMIFQLTDDCMDFETTEHVAKKPVQSDYEQNVITLPLIHAFQQSVDFQEKAKASEISRDEINQAVQRADGLNYTRFVAKKYYDKAVILLDEIELLDGKRARLTSLLENAFRVF
jgi:heptaprenyl diphosphate synthase